MKRINDLITSLDMGKAKRALHTLLTGGLQKCFNNHVISLTRVGQYDPLLLKASVPVFSLEMAGPNPAKLWRLRQATREQQPDLIQGWMYHGNLAAIAAQHFTSLKPTLAWNIRRSRETVKAMRVSTNASVKIGSWLSTNPDVILFNSVCPRNQHESIGYAVNSAHVIPNGFDTVRWSPDPAAGACLRQVLAPVKDVRILGFVARSHPDKDHRNLFHAYAQVAGKFQDWHLVCLGWGLADVASGELDFSRASFLGERQDISKIMQGFDLFCLSSQVEGFPNVLGEAMACDVPCVSTEVSDVITILGKTGWTVPPRNSAALASALSQAMTQSKEGLHARGQDARRRIINHYSLHSVIEHYRSLYTTLLGEC